MVLEIQNVMITVDINLSLFAAALQVAVAAVRQKNDLR
jgi:hypothetical protein